MQCAAFQRFHLEQTWTWRVPADWEIAKCSADKEAVTNNESQGTVTVQGMTDYIICPVVERC